MLFSQAQKTSSRTLPRLRAAGSKWTKRLSVTIDFVDSFGERLRSFLWQIVADAAGDGPVRVFAGEFVSVGTGVRMWGAVGIAFHGHGGHGDGRTCRQPLFKVIIFRLAFRQSQPPAVVVDDDGTVVRIVERRGAAIERGVVEVPFGRCDLPDQLGKIVPVFVVASAAAFNGK